MIKGYHCQKSVVRSMSRRLHWLTQCSSACRAIAAPDFHNGRWPSLNKRSTYNTSHKTVAGTFTNMTDK